MSITFSQTGVTSVTLQAPDLPLRQPGARPRQRATRTDAGTWMVVTLGDPDTEFNLSFGELPSADYSALMAFLADDLVNWQANAFTFTDWNSTAHSVRYLDHSDALIAPGLYTLELRLLKEVTT